MEEGFRKNGFHYLLVLRLVPLFPFWLVNLAPAFFGMSLRRYALATVIGIAPASIVFASLGSGLGSLLDAGQTPDLGISHTAVASTDFLGLALLALTPVVYRRLAPSAAPPSGPGNAERIEADLCIIGAGSAGLSVAAGAAQMGARAVLSNAASWAAIASISAACLRKPCSLRRKPRQAGGIAQDLESHA